MSQPFSALHCDLYELTMAQGYWHHSHNIAACFDMVIRKQPFDGGFTICAGIETVVDMITSLHFSDDDIAYLKSSGYFQDDFLKYLKGFRFTGTLFAVEEGQVVFPNEPIVRVHGNLIEAQIIEGLLLNVINYQSLIATKTARVYLATQQSRVVEFGMRRAHGIDGALSASRAAYIGGASATSFVAAGKRYDIPISGTMAHSWVMAFKDEAKAFDAFADVYRDNLFFILDTYSSLESGIIEAINIGKRLKKQNIDIGVRIDSGDIQYLSTKVRGLLDQAGLPRAKIAASNELDEHIIHQLVSANAPVDVWGVGTKLVTGYPDATLSGVYKLAAKTERGQQVAVMKVSDNPEKATNPGVKEVYRFYNAAGEPQADLISLADEDILKDKAIVFHHPSMDYRRFTYYNNGQVERLLKPYIKNGTLCLSLPSLHDTRAFALQTINRFDSAFLRLINPHVYRVSISTALKQLKGNCIGEIESNIRDKQ